MCWVYLLLAGLFEVAFATCLKLSEGFSKFWPTAAFFAFGGISLVLLTKAMVSIPLGTAYAVWTGIGALGTVTVGICLFQDPVDLWRIFFMTLLLGSLVGLKMVS